MLGAYIGVLRARRETLDVEETYASITDVKTPAPIENVRLVMHSDVD